MSNKSRLLCPAALAVAVSVGAIARAQTTTATWLSPVSGQWSDPTKWTSNPHYPTNGNPSGSIYDVIINAAGPAYTVSADFMPLTLDTLTVDSASATVSVATTYDAATQSYEPLTANTVSIVNGTLNAYRIVGATISSTNGSLVMSSPDSSINPTYMPSLKSVTVGDNLSIQNSTLWASGLTLQKSNLHLTYSTIGFGGSAPPGIDTVLGTGTIFLDGVPGSWGDVISSAIIGKNVSICTGTAGGMLGSTDFKQPSLIKNNGTISATTPGAWLQIVGTGFVNNGVVEASNGSGLSIQQPFTENGSIKINNANLQLSGTVDLSVLSSMDIVNSTVLIGGKLDNTGKTLDVHNGNYTFQVTGTGNITGGTIISPDGTSLRAVLATPLTSLQNWPILSNLVLSAPFLAPNLGPGGWVTFSGVDIRAPILVSGGDLRMYSNTLVNSDIDVVGGNLSLSIVSNYGKISAKQGARITLLSSPPTVGQIDMTDSTLVIQMQNPTVAQISSVSRSNSQVVLYRTTLNNSGGTLDLSSDKAWFLSDGAAVSGGTITAGAQSALKVGGWSGPDVGALDATTFSGSLIIGRQSGLDLTNSLLLNNASVSLQSAPAQNLGGRFFDGMAFKGSQELKGTGVISFDADPMYNAPSALYPISGTLTIGSGIKIETGGGFGVLGGTLGTIISDGMVLAQSAHGIAFGGPFLNRGVLCVQTGAGMNVPSLYLQNYASGTLSGGAYEVFDDSNLNLFTQSVTAPIATNAATILLSGPNSHFDAVNALALNQGSFTITAGRQFTTAGKLENAGMMGIGDHSLMTVSGDLALDPTSVLDLTLTSTADTLLEVQGTAILDGTLRITLAGGYEPAPGDTFQLFTAGAYNGDFASLDLPALPDGEQWVTDALSQGQLSVTPEPAAVGVLGVLAAAGLLRRRRSVAHGLA